jgi:hypothetical protein
VHLNPVCISTLKSKPIKDRRKYLVSYRWSSYASYITKSKALDFVQYGPILAQMGGNVGERAKRHRQFVEAGLAEDDKEFQEVISASPRSIGGDDFRAWADVLHQKRLKGHKRLEDISFRHITEPLSPDAVLAVLAKVFEIEKGAFCERRRNLVLRAVAARYLIRYAGLNQREVADILHTGSGSAISKQQKCYSSVFEEDRDLKRKLRQANATLEAQQMVTAASSKKRRSK